MNRFLKYILFVSIIFGGLAITFIQAGGTVPNLINIEGGNVDVSEGDIRLNNVFVCGHNLSYEGYDYSTVEIGEQCWFAEDLRYDDGCSGNTWNDSEPFNACDTQGTGYDGLLYQWGAAMDGSTTPGAQGLCPDGWHIPTDEELKELEGAVDSTYGYLDSEWDLSGEYRGDDAGDQLKDPEEEWCSDDAPPCGESGWDALPGGNRGASGSLYDVGSRGHWWSSSVDGDSAWYRNLNSSSSGVYRYSYSQVYGRSIRCLRD